jgi:ribonuclease PH
VELQGTGEKRSFSRSDLDYMLGLAYAGLKRLFALQRDVLGLTADETALFDRLASGD